MRLFRVEVEEVRELKNEHGSSTERLRWEKYGDHGSVTTRCADSH
jgi:hypothetical protein